MDDYKSIHQMAQELEDKKIELAKYDFQMKHGWWFSLILASFVWMNWTGYWVLESLKIIYGRN